MMLRGVGRRLVRRGKRWRSSRNWRPCEFGCGLNFVRIDSSPGSIVQL